MGAKSGRNENWHDPKISDPTGGFMGNPLEKAALAV